MELAVDNYYSEHQASKSTSSKTNKKRKWREIEAILDQRNLYKELEEFDEFGQFANTSDSAA